MKPLITNIQRFCVHDGPGIRTTVFFKGCSLHCPWCANPENISFEKQFYYIKEKCSEACKYIHECKAYETGVACERDMEKCYFGAVGQFGKYYSNEELYEELIKDMAFYGEDGGVTFSGGECLFFLPHYNQMVQKLREKKITTCVETALFVPSEMVKWAIENIDYFYVDIKSLQENNFKEVLGGELSCFLTNFEILYGSVSKDRIIYRIPLVHGVTLTKDNIKKIKDLSMFFPPRQIEIFNVHNLGAKKYHRLNMERRAYSDIDTSTLMELKKYLEETNVEVIINTI